MKRAFRSIIACFMMVCMFIAASDVCIAASMPCRLNLKKLNLTKSSSFNLRVYNVDSDQSVSFKSTNTDVVKIISVSDSRRSVELVGKAVGKATIKVTIRKKGEVVDTLKCKVTVTPVPVSIKFSDNSITMTEGNQAYIGSIIELIIKPYSAKEKAVFESSNEDVAVINTHGRITALDPGSCKITATLVSTGKKASFKLIVKKDPNPDDD